MGSFINFVVLKSAVFVWFGPLLGKGPGNAVLEDGFIHSTNNLQFCLNRQYEPSDANMDPDQSIIAQTAACSHRNGRDSDFCFVLNMNLINISSPTYTTKAKS